MKEYVLEVDLTMDESWVARVEIEAATKKGLDDEGERRII